jgi:uridine monophosphate synthetase
MQKEELLRQLVKIEAVRFGRFKLKSGIESPVYVDLRLVISYPKLLTALAEALHATARPAHYELLCGVPYTALPIATAISLQHNIPMVLRRKEKKDHGTGKIIEGVFRPGQRCLIVEDVITSGQSILETARELRGVGLQIEDAVVLIDRQQGGRGALEREGITLHAVATLADLLEEADILDHKRL